MSKRTTQNPPRKPARPCSSNRARNRESGWREFVLVLAPIVLPLVIDAVRKR